MQFYLGTWLHMRGVYPLHMEGQRGHEVALDKCKLVKGVQAGRICSGAVEFC